MHPPVYPSARVVELVLHQGCQADTLLHILVLHEFENNVGFRRIGIKPGIARLVVVLIQDDGVLALGHLQVGIGLGQTQCPGGCPTGRMVIGQGIGMDRDEQVRLGLVGYRGTTVQGDKDIALAGIEHLHIRTILFNQLPYGQGHPQVDVLLLRDAPDGTGVMASMPGVDDQHEVFRLYPAPAGRRNQQPSTDAYI